MVSKRKKKKQIEKVVRWKTRFYFYNYIELSVYKVERIVNETRTAREENIGAGISNGWEEVEYSGKTRD